MAYRIIDVKVAKVDVATNKLVIKRKKIKYGKTGYLKTYFNVDNNTLITGKDNRSLVLSDIKVNNRVTVDFVKADEGILLVKGITIL